MAEITIKRKGSIFGIIGKLPVFVGYEKVGKIGNGDTEVYPIQGEESLVKVGKSKILSVKSGQTVLVSPNNLIFLVRLILVLAALLLPINPIWRLIPLVLAFIIIVVVPDFIASIEE